MRERGLSLLELLLALVIVAVAMAAVSRTYINGLTFEDRYGRSVQAADVRAHLESRIGRLLAGAELTGASSFLVAPVPNQAAPQGGDSSEEVLGVGAPSLTLTTWNDAAPSPYGEETGQDFESLNSRFGPQGGAAEIALSTLPVGDAGPKRGLFLREQRPPDSDVAEGGQEGVLEETVREIRFEFYDGSAWQTSWDSRNGQKDKLPAAIRVTYLLLGDSQPHSFLVRLPLSRPSQGSGQ